MNNKINNYSPISVIDSEQLIRIGYVGCTDFSLEMYKKIINSSFENRYYSMKFRNYTKGYGYWDSDSECDFILLKSNPRKSKTEFVCLSSRVMRSYEMDRGARDYRERYIGNQFGIVPVIPYKFVSEIAKKSRYGAYNSYDLGYYPRTKIDFNVKYDEDGGLAPTKSQFNITEEKFSLPFIIDDELIVEDYNVYLVTTSKGKEIKAIKYNDIWFRIEPVKWKKIEDNLICTTILFESPIHIEKNYNTSRMENSDFVPSFDNTFLKWYIDNIFTGDLFKYIDCTFMKEQILLGLNEDINSKMKEIDRLKKIRDNLILQQQEQEHLIDTAHGNMTSPFEDERKNLEAPTKHR